MVHMPNWDMHGVGFQGELELTNAAEEGRGPAGEGGGLENMCLQQIFAIVF